MYFKIQVLMIPIVVFLLVGFSIAQIPNAGFENWTGGGPDGWFTNNDVGLAFITQSNTSNSGSSAVRGEVLDIGGGFGFGPILVTADQSGAIIGFPVSQKYQALTGYYQFNPSEGATLSISVTMGIAGGTDTTFVGTGAFVETGPVNSYTQFSAPIIYSPGSSDPNWAYIFIQIISSGGALPIGASMLIDDLSFSTTTDIADDLNNPVVQDFELAQNYPNPFNPSTRISFSLPQNSEVQIVIFDQLGQEVDRLNKGSLSAGSHTVQWTADNLPSGVYYYQLQAGDQRITRKMILMK
jgi:hypothetical protein